MENTSIISNALSNISDLLGSAVDIITGNEVMLVFLGIGLVCGGFRIFKAGKKAAK